MGLATGAIGWGPPVLAGARSCYHHHITYVQALSFSSLVFFCVISADEVMVWFGNFKDVFGIGKESLMIDDWTCALIFRLFSYGKLVKLLHINAGFDIGV